MEWISISERMPPKGMDVLLVEDGVVHKCSWHLSEDDDGLFFASNACDDDAMEVHMFEKWMPLPSYD